MRDVLPPESVRWRELVDRFESHARRYGYGPIQTPIIEDLAVFTRLGAGTDVVSKEMYEFEDRDGSRVALRPESTASVARAFVQHHPVVPWKVWYRSEHFRHENSQAGRYRQHHQLGAECFGSADPDVDVELIVLLWDFYASIGLRQLRLELNSIGVPQTREAYATVLTAFLEERREQLDPSDQEKIQRHPLRVLDSKRPATQAAISDAPVLLDTMGESERDHFARVQDGLNAAGVPFTINPRLVRGLDYYTHTVFEFVSEVIDASNSTIGGGGRYDGLVDAMGGASTPAVGFGTGIERILLAADAEGVFEVGRPELDAFVVVFGDGATAARDLCTVLRREGFAVERAFDGRSGRAQMKAADRSGARFALILGEDELAAGTVTVRDLRDGSEQVTVGRSGLIAHLRGASAH
jgi:histidyl-tRNA synthetase